MACGRPRERMLCMQATCIADRPHLEQLIAERLRLRIIDTCILLRPLIGSWHGPGSNPARPGLPSPRSRRWPTHPQIERVSEKHGVAVCNFRLAVEA